MPVTREDIDRAAELIAPHVVRTPCSRSQTLSQLCGAEIFLKFENLQFTASFKERGALVKLLALSQTERKRGVIAMSAGNHAQAVAYHARRLGIAAVIVMPRLTPNVKVEHTRALGAEVVLHGDTLSDSEELARNLCAQRNLVFVHPYDDDSVICGQGTVALEMLADHPDLDALVVPVGGGGLISGCAIAAKAERTGIEIVGVQAARYPSMKQALAGRPIECGRSTIAEGIAVKAPGKRTLPVLRELVADIVLVEEADLEKAVLLLLQIEKSVVEGAGAAALAAVLRERERFAGRKLGLLLSGGNIDLLILSSIIERGLARTGRLVQLRVTARDVPGSLAEVARCIAAADASVIEVRHSRAFTTAPVASVDIEFTLHTRGLDHLESVIAALQDAGFEATRIDWASAVHRSDG